MQSEQDSGEICICTDTGLVCTTVTIHDCYCPDGYYKNPAGECVEKSTCIYVPPCDGDLQTYQEEGEECICESSSATTYFRGGLQSVIRRQKYKGLIIPSHGKQSGKTASRKPTFVNSLSTNQGAKYRPSPTGLVCAIVQAPACYCPPDYYKDPNGVCVLKSSCVIVPVCPGDEIYQSEGEKCICDSNVGLICIETLVKGCYCPDGYYRDSYGSCVAKDTCVISE